MTSFPHVVIRDVRPSVDAGRYPAKRVFGRPCPVEATIFRDGPGTIRAVVRWRRAGKKKVTEIPMTCVNPGIDLWRAELPVEEPGRVLFSIEAWTDLYVTWLRDLDKRVGVGQEVQGEVFEGVAILKKMSLPVAAKNLGAAANDPGAALRVASDSELLEQVERSQPRAEAVRSEKEYPVQVGTPKGHVGAWYEMFPRSQGETPGPLRSSRTLSHTLCALCDGSF